MIKSINHNEQFKLLNRIGKKTFTEHFIFITCQKKHLIKSSCSYFDSVDKLTYLGIKASKKIGGAAVRNKIKRRIKHAVRLLASEHEQFYDIACVIIPKTSCAKASFINLKDNILKAALSVSLIIKN